MRQVGGRWSPLASYVLKRDELATVSGSAFFLVVLLRVFLVKSRGLSLRDSEVTLLLGAPSISLGFSYGGVMGGVSRLLRFFGVGHARG